MIVNRAGEPVNVAGLYSGAPAFAHLGGPSTKALPLELLGRRGCLIFALNNSPASLPAPIRPNVWLHNDPCRKFHPSIWYDPAILKFSPVNQWGNLSLGEKTTNRKQHGLRRRAADDGLDFIPGACARDMAGCLGFVRNSTFNPLTFLTEGQLNQGNDKHSACKMANGWPHVINSLFTILRLAHYLGVSRLYLLGCDFRMEPQTAYSWNQTKDQGGADGANEGFAKMLIMLDALQPVFLKSGYQVYNCNPRSACWTFPYRSFADAIDDATGSIDQELDCRGFYDPPRIAS